MAAPTPAMVIPAIACAKEWVVAMRMIPIQMHADPKRAMYLFPKRSWR